MKAVLVCISPRDVGLWSALEVTQLGDAYLVPREQYEALVKAATNILDSVEDANCDAAVDLYAILDALK